MLHDRPSTVDEIQDTKKTTGAAAQETPVQSTIELGSKPADWPTELGGPQGPEPTRYGDWEQKGRCSDF